MYLALYRKYRPRTFADVISQPHITTTLTNQLKNGQISHAYLFTGSRGTGKTSCAKILAKAVNCLSPVDGNPCLECEACLSIENGASDITEIDAASNNGVDDVRALRDEVMYSPVSCKYRVYIIDEVHMLSVAAFNALLKTIEEPPEHVIFILATTESHKVPATILSRCQRFEFHRIDMSDSAKRLCGIAKAENVSLDEDAALLIARLSDGGMRDALSLLDQCISQSSRITVETVRDCAGVVGNDHLFSLAESIIACDAASALNKLGDLYNRSKDPARLVEELIIHFRNLMMIKVMPDQAGKITLIREEADAYVSRCAKMSLEQIMRSLSILEDGLNLISRSKQRKTQAEMCFIRLCTPKLDSDTKALSLRLDALEQKIANGDSPAVKTAPIPPTPSEQPVIRKNEEAKAPVQTKSGALPLFPNEIVNSAPSESAVPEKETLPPPWEDEPVIPPQTETPAADIPETNTESAASNAPYEYDDGYIPPIDDAYAPPVREDQNRSVIAEKRRETKAPAPYSPVPAQEMQEMPSGEFLNEWVEILEALPMYLGGILDGSEAYTDGKNLNLRLSDTQQTLLKKEDNRAALNKAIETVTNRKFNIVFPNNEKKSDAPTQTKLDKFLTSAKEQGIAIITQGTERSE